jgi:hypothetical protein
VSLLGAVIDLWRAESIPGVGRSQSEPLQLVHLAEREGSPIYAALASRRKPPTPTLSGRGVDVDYSPVTSGISDAQASLELGGCHAAPERSLATVR